MASGSARRVETMRTLLVGATLLTLLVLLPAPAQAQQTGSLVLHITPSDAPLREDGTLVLSGFATLTVDTTAVLAFSGIPVMYTIETHPAWASAIVSPSTDVFPAPMAGAAPGLSYTVTRSFTISVSAATLPMEDVTDILRMGAETTPHAMGRPVYGSGEALLTYDAPDEPCPEHAVTQEQLATWAAQAADAYNEQQASGTQQAPEEVTVQDAGASPIPLPWAAVGGCAILGAGIGLAMRRRLAR